MFSSELLYGLTPADVLETAYLLIFSALPDALFVSLFTFIIMEYFDFAGVDRENIKKALVVVIACAMVICMLLYMQMEALTVYVGTFAFSALTISVIFCVNEFKKVFKTILYLLIAVCILFMTNTSPVQLILIVLGENSTFLTGDKLVEVLVVLPGRGIQVFTLILLYIYKHSHPRIIIHKVLKGKKVLKLLVLGLITVNVLFLVLGCGIIRIMAAGTVLCYSKYLLLILLITLFFVSNLGLLWVIIIILLRDAKSEADYYQLRLWVVLDYMTNSANKPEINMLLSAIKTDLDSKLREK